MNLFDSNDIDPGDHADILADVLRENGYSDKAVEDLLYAAYLDATGDDDQPWTPGSSR